MLWPEHAFSDRSSALSFSDISLPPANLVWFGVSARVCSLEDSNEPKVVLPSQVQQRPPRRGRAGVCVHHAVLALRIRSGASLTKSAFSDRASGGLTSAMVEVLALQKLATATNHRHPPRSPSR